MKELLLLLICAACFVGHKSADTVCSPDWTSFKDEKCFKILDDTPRTFDNAEKACAALESSSTLAIIHTKDEQDFLSKYLFKTSKKLENFWIGAKFSSGKYNWIDNSELSYVNWDATRGPRNKPNYCVQMEYDEAVVGRWADEPCETKNFVVCQKLQIWSLERLQKAFLNSQKAFLNSQKEIQELKQKLENVHVSGDSKQNSIPIGFVYTQLPGEKTPTDIWPSLQWTDVSSTYAGVFFRVEGSGSEPFGKTQMENDRTVIRMESSLNGNITIDSSADGHNTKTSGWIYTGDWAKERIYAISLSLVTSTGEVRPRNMAIRLWKRTG